MTFETFLAECKYYGIKMKIVPDTGSIPKSLRSEEGGCPICELYYHKKGNRYGNTAYMFAGKALGMTKELILAIVKAADNRSPTEEDSKRYRQKMITALVKKD